MAYVVETMSKAELVKRCLSAAEGLELLMTGSITGFIEIGPIPEPPNPPNSNDPECAGGGPIPGPIPGLRGGDVWMMLYETAASLRYVPKLLEMAKKLNTRPPKPSAVKRPRNAARVRRATRARR